MFRDKANSSARRSGTLRQNEYAHGFQRVSDERLSEVLRLYGLRAVAPAVRMARGTLNENYLVQTQLGPKALRRIRDDQPVGPQAGRKVVTLKLAAPAATSSVPKPFTVARDGFSLNAAVACAPHQRERIDGCVATSPDRPWCWNEG